MNTRHLVDPELLPMLDQFPAFELGADNLGIVRRLSADNVLAPPPDTVDVVEVRVPACDERPATDLRLYLPDATIARPMGCILHIHGGGYVLGAARQSEAKVRTLVRALGCAIASVDYRLAPEHPYPAAIDDCFAAFVWLAEHAGAHGIDLGRMGVLGESAGGGLAAALALMTRDRGGPFLAFQQLIYPMLDDRTCLREQHGECGEFVWTPQSNWFGWAALLGQQPGSDDVSAYAAPARAEDLSGLPPCYISTGNLDLFYDENVTYGERMRKAGTDVTLNIYSGAFHGFDLVPHAEVARRARRDQRAWLATRLTRGS